MKGDAPLESELRIPKIFKEIRSSSTVSQIIWHSRARKSEVFDPSAPTSVSSALRRGDEASRPLTIPPLLTGPLPSNRIEKQVSLESCTSTTQPLVTEVDEKPVCLQPQFLAPKEVVVETPFTPTHLSCFPIVEDVRLQESIAENLLSNKQPADLLIVKKTQCDEDVDTSELNNETHHEMYCADLKIKPPQHTEDEVVSHKHSVVDSIGVPELGGDVPSTSDVPIEQRLREELCPDAEEEMDVELVFRREGVSLRNASVCLGEPLKECGEWSFSLSTHVASSNFSSNSELAQPQSESILQGTSSHVPKNRPGLPETEPRESLPSLSCSKPSSPLPFLDQQLLGEVLEEPSSFPQSPFSPIFSDEPFSPESVESEVGNVPATPISPTSTSAWTELEDTVFGESTSSMSNPSMPLLKRIERLKLGIVQLRNFPMENEDVQLVVNVKFDAYEVFQSTSVPSGANCTFGDETNCELPPKFHALHLVITQMLEGGRLTRPIGRVSLRRKELINGNDSFDGWMPIVRIAGSQTTEILGDMCLDVSYNTESSQLFIGVLDYTVWPLSTATSQNYQRLQDTNTSKAGLGSGRLYLRACISSDKSLFSSMKKSRVVERRTLDNIRLDCSQLLSSSSKHYANPDDNKSPPPKGSHNLNDPKRLPPKPPKSRSHVIPTASQKISFKPVPGVQEDVNEGIATSLSVSSISASSSTATTPSWKMTGANMTPTSTPTQDVGGNRPIKATGNFFFPSSSSPRTSVVKKEFPKPSDSSRQSQHQLRLNIKVYSEASYDENAYCGYVRVPLDNKSMLPKDLPLGPNWFNIKSRAVNSALDSSSAECNTTAPSFTKSTANNKDYSPAHFRHCSSPSTSAAANNLVPPHHHKAGSGSLGKSGLFATRSQPLKPTPSLASLRGLLTGNSNAMGHCNPAASSSTKTAGRDASVDSIARAMSNADKLGEMRLRLWYNVEEVLPFFHYQPLYTNLIKSLGVKPYSTSLTSLLSYLPIDMEHIARPLMKIFVHCHQIRAFFRLVCSEYVSSCHDVNTLFRSQTMASKIMYELMKFVGHDYLIYAERKCCEIDPSKLKPGDSLEHNLRNITVYAELAFSRVVDSYTRCPHVLREVFLELREVVHTHFPGRDDVARLALSSFLIMRFFAAAILNPKLFALKRDTPDPDVCRTLVLVSKILQRLANCVVSSVPLTTKEQWLTPVLMRFSSDVHKAAMIDFLDGVSAVSPERDHSANDENVSPTVYKESPVVLLKHGQMVERRSGHDKKRSFKNLIHQKRRYVTLTETQLSWQKVKDATSAGVQPGDSPLVDVDQHKGFALSEITAVSPLPEVKNSFRVATPSSEVHFQANNASEMNEWLIVILKQQRRHIMQLNRPSFELNHLLPPTSKASISPVVDVDMEREMQIIHSHFYVHLDTLQKWKNALESQHLDQFLHQLNSNGGQRSKGVDVMGLPLDKIFSANTVYEEQKICLEKLRETIVTTIDAIEQIQAAHQSAKNICYQTKLMQGSPRPELSPTKSMTLDQIISSPATTAISGQKMVDSENYLHLRQRNKRIKKSTAQLSAKMPTPLQPATISENKMLLGVQQPQPTNI